MDSGRVEGFQEYIGESYRPLLGQLRTVVIIIELNSKLYA